MSAVICNRYFLNYVTLCVITFIQFGIFSANASQHSQGKINLLFIHCENISTQYKKIQNRKNTNNFQRKFSFLQVFKAFVFTAVKTLKNGNFHRKLLFFYFVFKILIMGTRRGGSNEYPQSTNWVKMEKK